MHICTLKGSEIVTQYEKEVEFCESDIYSSWL